MHHEQHHLHEHNEKMMRETCSTYEYNPNAMATATASAIAISTGLETLYRTSRETCTP